MPGFSNVPALRASLNNPISVVCMRRPANGSPRKSPICSRKNRCARAWPRPHDHWRLRMRRNESRIWWKRMQTKQQLIEFLGAKPRHVHFVGIGGCGMSGLARLLLQQGHQVTGSDMAPNGETTGLRKLGAKIHTGHATRHVHSNTDLLVFTSAVTQDNDELKTAAELKIPAVRRGRLLTALMTHRNNIAVAGTHGKTTTTAMIAHVLTRGESAPSF